MRGHPLEILMRTPSGSLYYYDPHIVESVPSAHGQLTHLHTLLQPGRSDAARQSCQTCHLANNLTS